VCVEKIFTKENEFSFYNECDSLCGLGGHGIEWLRLGSRKHWEGSVPACFQQRERETGESPEPADWKVCATTQIGQIFYSGFTHRRRERGKM